MSTPVARHTGPPPSAGCPARARPRPHAQRMAGRDQARTSAGGRSPSGTRTMSALCRRTRSAGRRATRTSDPSGGALAPRDRGRGSRRRPCPARAAGGSPARRPRPARTGRRPAPASAGTTRARARSRAQRGPRRGRPARPPSRSPRRSPGPTAGSAADPPARAQAVATSSEPRTNRPRRLDERPPRPGRRSRQAASRAMSFKATTSGIVASADRPGPAEAARRRPRDAAR